MPTADLSSQPLHSLEAHTLIEAYRQRTLSPVEVTEAVIRQIERWEPALCATWLYRPEAALAQARAAEARWLKGQPLGLLDGVPATLKDNIATEGDPTPLGSAAVSLTPAAADAPPAARMKEAGAVIVSKTTMPDYGMLSSGLSTFHALARNPWDLSKGPGGSSSGAGAAAAAGYGPLHIGTDIGGSIRLPASWCGIFGLKPSLGRIPIDPPYTGRAAGPMTRSVADAALMMQVLSQPDARDSTSLPWQDIAWSQFDAGVDALRGLRIGLLLPAGRARGAGRRRTRGRPAGPGRRPHRAPAALHDPGHARGHGPLLAHALAHRPVGPATGPGRQGAALHPPMGRQRRRPERGRGLQRQPPVPPDPPGQREGQQRLRLRDLAHRAHAGLPGRTALAHRRPAAWAGAHRLHRALQHVGAARRLDQLWLHPRRPAHRSANRRRPLRRPGRAAGGPRIRTDPRSAAPLARTAASMTPR